ncbi:MAG: hypothetical protein ACYC5K_02390 [Saccharofermentanales bacterium]
MTLFPKLAIAIFAQIALTILLAMTDPKTAVTVTWLYVVFCACLVRRRDTEDA